MHPVYSTTLRRGTIVTSQPRDLSLASSIVYLLLLYKPNPRLSPNPPYYSKIRLTSRVLVVSLGAR
jgi:hypothetical protein